MAPLPPRVLDREGGEPPGSGVPPTESTASPREAATPASVLSARSP